MQRKTMETIMMEFAESIAQRSTCEERKVGAVVTSIDFQKVYSIGYNGAAKGLDNHCLCAIGEGKYGCVHAEQNALVKCNSFDNEKVLFVTLSPCVMCSTLLINEGGYSKVYYREEWKDNPGVQLLQRAGIRVHKI